MGAGAGHWRRGVVLVATAIALAVVPHALAVENETFGLVPFPERVEGSDRRTFVVPLDEGMTFRDAARVYNTTDQSLALAVYAADAEAGLDGAISVGFRGTDPVGVGSWIDIETEELTLPPRGEEIVRFKVTVRSAEPAPDLGAVVVENTAPGLRADVAQRLHLVVRTSPAGSPTTSDRVRPIFFRSPWIIVAIVGLLLVAALIWLVARRAGRTEDDAEDVGELTAEPALTERVPEGSRPVLHHYGKDDEEDELTEILTRQTGSSTTEASTNSDDPLDRLPPLEDLLDDEDQSAPRERERVDGQELNYIPLEDL